MNVKLLKIICCPTCKGTLIFDSIKQDGDEVIEGKLNCQSCKVEYPIKNGIPNLLPKEYHETISNND
jgi:uncharacterized protein YbaR (Trm112 family)